MFIGCKRYTHAEWDSFSDEDISDMESMALAFWKIWEEPLILLCKTHFDEAEKIEQREIVK